MNFSDLVKAIRDVDSVLVARATKAVNVSLTMRNWLIGHYVSEYELNGADRADYGKRILAELSDRLEGVSNCNKRQLSRYVRFYRTYPQIGGTASPQFAELLPSITNHDFEPLPFTKYEDKIEGTESPQFEIGVMENMTFEELVEVNCFAQDESEKRKAADLLEQRYCCEIRCANMDKSVLFAHHARNGNWCRSVNYKGHSGKQHCLWRKSV